MPKTAAKGLWSSSKSVSLSTLEQESGTWGMSFDRFRQTFSGKALGSFGFRVGVQKSGAKSEGPAARSCGMACLVCGFHCGNPGLLAWCDM